DSTMLGADAGEPAADENPLGEPAADGTEADPNISMDELLGEAAAVEAAQAAAYLGADLPPPQGPTFQLHLHGLTEEKRPVLRKLLEAQGLSMPERSGGPPVISQLSE